MKKVLSVALAMVFALSSAALVSANGLSKEAHAYLAKLGMKVEEKKEPSLYESWSSKDEYEALKKQLIKADKDLKQDSEQWAKLQTIACEAFRLAEEAKHELASVETLKAAANDTVEVDFGTNGKAFATLAIEKKVKELKAAIAKVEAGEEPAEAEVAAANILGEELKPAKPAVSKDEKKAALEEKITELYKSTQVEGYQEARKFVKENYSREVVNKRVAKLNSDVAYYNGVAKFVGEVAAKTGLKFEKCALPADVTPAPAAKAEGKKDMVPNTAAAFGCAF